MIHIVMGDDNRPFVAFDMSKAAWDELDSRWRAVTMHPGPIPEAPIPMSALDYPVLQDYFEAAKKHYGKIMQHADDWRDWFKRCAIYEEELNLQRERLNLDASASPTRVKVAWLVSSGFTAEDIRYV